jgi:glutathione peroxidase
MASIYDFSPLSTARKPQPLSAYRGQVLLVVNVASKCGFTPQYKGLEALQQKYGPRGFAVLGFPCNQFGGQEPGTEAEIQEFCELNFGVSFPLFAKVEVNGKQAAPLFQFLKKERPGLLGTEAIKWNFTKFVVNRQGEVVKRFAPTEKPTSLERDIEAYLNA